MTDTTLQSGQRRSGYPQEPAGRLEGLYESRVTLAYSGHHSLQDLLNIGLRLSETFI